MEIGRTDASGGSSVMDDRYEPRRKQPPFGAKMTRLLLGILLGGLLMAGGGWAESDVHDALTTHWTRSYILYGRTHAVWLDGYESVGINRPILEKVLSEAERQRKVPEIVVYSIPLRDLGQSSEGGFDNYQDYYADKVHDARLIADFVEKTGIRPRIVIEPDALSLAVQYREDNNDNEKSGAIYRERIRIFQKLIPLYQDAGARVYLEAGHSGWFDYGGENLNRIATALNEAGIARADGLMTNVSNRQLVVGPPVNANGTRRDEAHYLSRLLPRLDNPDLDVVVDTSRNGRQRGGTHPRVYYLAPDGAIYDNEHGDPVENGRKVGHWFRGLATPLPNWGVPKDYKPDWGGIWLSPEFGKLKPLGLLLDREKYIWDEEHHLLTAPPWLDPVGDVQLGPAPTDDPPETVADVIDRFRYIKPPDDCDGSLGCPPGESKSAINARLN